MSILRFILAIALLVCAAACGEDEVAPGSATLEAVPGLCAPVAEHFGHTMQGPCAADDLLTILHALYVVEDRHTLALGSAHIAQYVDDACQSSACAAGSTFELCLVRLESALRGNELGCGEPTCGNGVCEAGEFVITVEQQVINYCEADCACGNGVCEPERGETETDCPLDCQPVCGDGVCRHREHCGAPPPDEPPGSHVQCDQDCCAVGWVPRVCGDGVCAPDVQLEGPLIEGESAATCEADCGAGRCGDGICLPPETSERCPDDCTGAINCLLASERGDPLEVCGDAVCAGCEVWTCAMDCEGVDFALCTRDESGALVCPPTWCGDATCAGGAENSMTCPQDCTGVAPDGTPCGDAYCDWSESCEADCAP